MRLHARALFVGAMLPLFAAVPLRAQESPPTYQADPTAFKLIYEDANFRMIEITWAPGQMDKPHSHPVAGVTYPLTDCKIKITNPDGTTVDRSWQAGKPTATPVTKSHTSMNVGPAACHGIIVERK